MTPSSTFPVRTWYTLLSLALAGLWACSTPQKEDATTVTTTALTPQEAAQYRQDGRMIVKASFDTLSHNLMRAMGEGGPLHALQFCNLQAYPLTDSLSEQFNAHIKRTSLQYRNPGNQPDAQEKALLTTFAAWKSQGRDLATADTVVMLDNDQVLFAKPILLQPQCQACHGVVGGTVPQELYREIQQLYPADKAVGFRSGDLRGMWAIRFKRQL
ncbi:MAG: DUF3365 domain-containing protein [Hymenobacteraceae bacterium]|nr:DUF3365 domain-containing protein [Hymenobacteraceae bacterium]